MILKKLSLSSIFKFIQFHEYLKYVIYFGKKQNISINKIFIYIKYSLNEKLYFKIKKYFKNLEISIN